MGGTAYLIVNRDRAGRPTNILVDAPALDPDILQFIDDLGGVQRWVITHRGAVGEAKALQAHLQCKVLLHEQEAYLLPNVAKVVTFSSEINLDDGCEVIWTPGYSPGSACVYIPWHGGVLFSGRHLLPDRNGQLRPLRFSKTFHWPRQLKSVEQLQTRFSADSLAYVCPAANTGFLRGKSVVKDAYTQLETINVAALRNIPIVL